LGGGGEGWSEGEGEGWEEYQEETLVEAEEPLIKMELQLQGRGAEFPTAELLLDRFKSMGVLNYLDFRSMLMPLLDLLLSFGADESANGTRFIEQYNSCMYELGVETESAQGMQLPSTVAEAVDHLQAENCFVPFVLVHEPSHGQQLQLVTALTFELKEPQVSAATTTVRLALWDVYTHKAFRRRGLYTMANCAILEELAQCFSGIVCIELSCKDVPEAVGPHEKVGYRRTGSAAQELSMEQVERVKAVVQTMRAAQPQRTLNAALVLAQLDRELGGAQGDRAALVADVRGALRPSPLLQPSASDGRSDWMEKEGVPPWVVRGASSWAGSALERLCQYILASGNGPSLLSRGAWGTALTYPIARNLEAPAWVSTCLRNALGLEYRAPIPNEVALVSAIDLAAAVLVGSPPPDLPNGTEQRDVAVRVFRAHLLDGRCMRGRWGVGSDWGRRKPCALCAAYPKVLAATEQLVGLATRHVDCCLPVTVRRPASDDRRWSDQNLHVVSVTLRRDGICAKTKQEPPLWAMCAHLHTSYTYIILSDTDVEYIHTIHTFNTEQHLSTLYSQSYGSMLR